jgi:uncharacterized protein
MMPTLEQARAWYTHEDPVHDFAHIQRVHAMATRLAAAEGADLEIVQAAALLHDAEGSTSGSETRADHHHASADFAAEVLQKEGWPLERIVAVQHCIRAHRFRDNREPPATIEAKVLFDADKLDVIGAIGVARVIAYAVLAGQPVYAEPSAQFIETGKELPGEPHSAYHEHLFKLRKIKDRLFTATAKTIAVERHEYICAYFQRLQDEMAARL